jgi:hypothetical protein
MLAKHSPNEIHTQQRAFEDFLSFILTSKKKARQTGWFVVPVTPLLSSNKTALAKTRFSSGNTTTLIPKIKKVKKNLQIRTDYKIRGSGLRPGSWGIIPGLALPSFFVDNNGHID